MGIVLERVTVPETVKGMVTILALVTTITIASNPPNGNQLQCWPLVSILSNQTMTLENSEE